MLIPLFDIDGTLININGSGRRVMTLALKEVYGLAGPIERVSFAGTTDLSIVYETLLAAGLHGSEIEAGLPELFRVMTVMGSTLFFENGLSPCPGAVELIQRLADHPDVAMGLLTGNVEGTARLKLEAAGFDPDFFQFGAYGSEASERQALAPIALKRARVLIGPAVAEFSAIIIGDTPADIHCGRASNIPVLAVATGTFSMSLLTESKPDFLVKDLSNIEQVLDLLFSIMGGSNDQAN